MHTARARGPDRAVAVEGVVPPADPASVLGGYPLQGFSVAASAAVEVPLIGVAAEFLVSEFEAALRLKPEDTDYRGNLGIAYLQRADFEAAIDGALFGVVVSLRLLTIALAFLLMVATTPPTRIVQGLMKLGLPFKYATLVTMIFRFYPVMAGEFVEIQQAQASRGFEVEKGSFFRKFMNLIPLMIPSLLSALRKSTVIAIALEFRGYSLNTKRHFIHDAPVGRVDVLLLSFTILLLAACLALRFADYLV